MKRSPSIVWRFFDRLTDGSRCLGVMCKLCNTQYKFFGNTTNLRVHLSNKHAIQWELAQSGHFDEAFQVDDSSNQVVRKRSYRVRDKNVRYSVNVDLNKNNSNKDDDEEENMPIIEIQRVNVLENSDVEGFNEDDEATINMVRQMHAQESDEEWLDETAFITQKDKKKRYKVKKIKREVCSPPPRRSSSFYLQNQSKHDLTEYTDELVKDEYSVFGEYIANKLRKIKTARTRGNIQQMITTILWQAEYGSYDQADSVKRMLLLSMQEAESTQAVHVMESNIQSEVEMQEEPNQSIQEIERIEIIQKTEE